MRNLPLSRQGTLEFVRSHMDLWAERAAELGLTSEQTQRVIDLYEQAKQARDAAIAAHDAAKAATLASNHAIANLRDATSAAIAQIKAQAPANPNVFVEAHLNRPTKPSRDAATALTPGVVRNTSVTLTPRGEPVLNWKPPAPKDARERDRSSSGLVYTIRRIRRDEHGRVLDDRIIATTGRTNFTDQSAAGGSTYYLVRASRGKHEGIWGGGMLVELGGVGGLGRAAREPMLAAA